MALRETGLRADVGDGVAVVVDFTPAFGEERKKTMAKGRKLVWIFWILALGLAVTSVPASAQEEGEDPGFPEPTGDESILPEGATLERVFDGGCVLTEGPAAGPDGYIYFSDITFTEQCPAENGSLQAGVIYRYDPESRETEVYRSPSGMSNGLKFDADDNLLAAEGADFGGRRVTKTDLTTGESVIIAGLYEGRPFNSPNDITIDEQGRIYFSDPRYNGHEPLDQPVQGVYRIDTDGSIERIISNAGKPNGVLVSPDQQTLYVNVNDQGVEDEQRLSKAEVEDMNNLDQAVYAYDLNTDGTVGERRKIVGYLPEAGPDGLEADEDGNIYVAVRAESAPGIYVYDPEGNELARIPTGDELPTNVGFGRDEEGNVLYVTSGNSLYRITLNSEGYQLPSS